MTRPAIEVTVVTEYTARVRIRAGELLAAAGVRRQWDRDAQCWTMPRREVDLLRAWAAARGLPVDVEDVAR